MIRSKQFLSIAAILLASIYAPLCQAVVNAPKFLSYYVFNADQQESIKFVHGISSTGGAVTTICGNETILGQSGSIGIWGRSALGDSGNSLVSGRYSCKTVSQSGGESPYSSFSVYRKGIKPTEIATSTDVLSGGVNTKKVYLDPATEGFLVTSRSKLSGSGYLDVSGLFDACSPLRLRNLVLGQSSSAPFGALISKNLLKPVLTNTSLVQSLSIPVYTHSSGTNRHATTEIIFKSPAQGGDRRIFLTFTNEQQTSVIEEQGNKDGFAQNHVICSLSSSAELNLSLPPQPVSMAELTPAVTKGGTNSIKLLAGGNIHQNNIRLGCQIDTKPKFFVNAMSDNGAVEIPLDTSQIGNHTLTCESQWYIQSSDRWASQPNSNMEVNYSVVEPIRHFLSVSASIGGKIISSPAGIDCPNDCTEQYTENTNVTLTATASLDYQFSSWSGDLGSCLESTRTCAVLMNRARSLSSNFVLIDQDNDGHTDRLDNCPNNSNSNQSDKDFDGIGDVCDPTPNGDSDNDGVDNLSDNCPSAYNPNQQNTDTDNEGDSCDIDDDNDSVEDFFDNCQFISNRDQLDTDSDLYGDACDDDDDDDNALDHVDNCPLVANPNQEDEDGYQDGEGAGDACEIRDDGLCFPVKNGTNNSVLICL